MDHPHIPALRLGRAYESLEKIDARDHRNGEPVAAVSQVNAGIIRRDLARSEASRAVLKKFTCAQFIDMCAQAAEIFMNNTLPFGDKGHTQSPQQYIEDSFLTERAAATRWCGVIWTASARSFHRWGPSSTD